MKKEYNISIDKDAQAFSVGVPRRIVLPLTNKVKTELGQLEKLQVIQRVTTPTEWCVPILIMPKSNDKVRICVNYTRPNKSVKTECHILLAVDYVLGQLIQCQSHVQTRCQ